MSIVLSLKMAVSWAGAAVDHSTAAAHRAARDVRSVRFMMRSSTAFLGERRRKRGADQPRFVGRNKRSALRRFISNALPRSPRRASPPYAREWRNALRLL